MRTLFFTLAGLAHVVAAFILLYNRETTFALAQCAAGAVFVVAGLYRETRHD